MVNANFAKLAVQPSHVVTERRETVVDSTKSKQMPSMNQYSFRIFEMHDSCDNTTAGNGCTSIETRSLSPLSWKSKHTDNNNGLMYHNISIGTYEITVDAIVNTLGDAPPRTLNVQLIPNAGDPHTRQITVGCAGGTITCVFVLRFTRGNTSPNGNMFKIKRFSVENEGEVHWLAGTTIMMKRLE